jgi:hypothetical protein
MEYAEKLYAATWSNDSKTIYYNSGLYSERLRDIWSIDIHSGIKTNISNTENRREGWPRLFGVDNKLIFSSSRIDEDHPYFFGYLTSMNPDGSEYHVYSEERDNGNFNVSPDEDSAAIFGGELFTSNYIFQKLSPRITNEDKYLDYQLVDPAWSPDGNHIGWSVEINKDQARSYGIGIHNLENNTIRLLYPYMLLEGEGFPRAPEWSPDGWVSVKAPNPENKNWGLYIIKTDGTEEYFFEEFDNVIWGPGTEKIILNTGNVFGPSNRGVWITRLGDWKPVGINLPQDAVVIDWIDPDVVKSWIGDDS